MCTSKQYSNIAYISENICTGEKGKAKSSYDQSRVASHGPRVCDAVDGTRERPYVLAKSVSHSMNARFTLSKGSSVSCCTSSLFTRAPVEFNWNWWSRYRRHLPPPHPTPPHLPYHTVFPHHSLFLFLSDSSWSPLPSPFSSSLFKAWHLNSPPVLP